MPALMRVLRLFSLLTLCGALLFPLGQATAIRQPAVAILVDTLDDELNTDGDCSLREAIIAANTDAPRDACPAGSGADTIDLPAGDYVFALAGTDEDAAATGDLDITHDLTLTGAGKASTIIDGHGLDRVFDVRTFAISVQISDVTITGGDSNGFIGGGILLAHGNGLTLTNSRVKDNTGSAGIYVTGLSTLTLVNTRVYNHDQKGIVIGSGSTATLINSLVSDNTTIFEGAGITNTPTATATLAFTPGHWVYLPIIQK